MTDGDYLWCAVNLLLDDEETLAQLCPACRERAMEARCPVCGRAQRPRGRFFPGLGYNGTDTITCEHCGAVSPLAAWMKGRDRDAGPGRMEIEE